MLSAVIFTAEYFYPSPQVSVHLLKHDDNFKELTSRIIIQLIADDYFHLRVRSYLLSTNFQFLFKLSLVQNPPGKQHYGSSCDLCAMN